MTKDIYALEPSFADAITAITASPDLSLQARRHWCSSLTGIAKAFVRTPRLPPEVILQPSQRVNLHQWG